MGHITGRMPQKQFDMVWYHPPYWDIIRYSEDPKDLSNCDTMEEFGDMLNRSVERLTEALKPGGIMAILIGDKRRTGSLLCTDKNPAHEPEHRRAKGNHHEDTTPLPERQERIWDTQSVPHTNQTRILPGLPKAAIEGSTHVPNTTTRCPPSNPPANLMEVNEHEIRETKRR